MDFFDRQDRARRNTRLLVVYFVAGVALLVLTVYLAVMLVFGLAGSGHRGYESSLAAGWWNPTIFLVVAAGTLAVITIGSISKTAQLAQGGSAVATMLGGRPVNPDSNDPDERKLLNVVEEMAIASGVPVPQVYVLENEKGINAFAAGHSPSDAVVAVTQGCLRLLSRDELQGVIGHEFSHILNGDMRLNLRLMGIIFGIVCLTVIGRVLLRMRGGRSSRERNPLPLLGLLLLLIGWIGVVFARLMQAAVSRQREFLADASAVQFTRNPVGLSAALQKIGGHSYGSKLQAAQAPEASHMFFGNGLGESLFHLTATHPPLEQRIRAIDPNWDGTFPAVRLIEEPLAAQKPAAQRSPFPFPFPGAPQPRAGLSGLTPPVIAASAVLPNLGNPTTAHLQYAAELRNAIPAPVQESARDPLGASALVFCLLLSADAEQRRKQLDILSRSWEGVRQETERLLPAVESVALQAKLPLADLALPSLRRFSPLQYRQFSDTMQQLIASDEEVDLFEYVLQKIVLRHLDPQFTGARKAVVQYYSLKPLAGDCAVLLSALAHVGQDDPEKARAAFEAGARQLAYFAQKQLEFLPADAADLPQVDAALNRLGQAVPQIKKNVLNACAQTVAADGAIKDWEAELLRAIADTLDCPIPPFIKL